MITLKSPREIEPWPGRGGSWPARSRSCGELVRPGLSTEDLDAAAETFIRSHDGATPSFKGLYGFPKTLCTSIDEEIVHGIPSTQAGAERGQHRERGRGRAARGASRRFRHDAPGRRDHPRGRAAPRSDPGVPGRGHRAGAGGQSRGRHRPRGAAGGGGGGLRRGARAGGPRHRHPVPRGAAGAELRQPQARAAPARGNDARHRADDHHREPGHQDARRQVDRRDGRRQPRRPTSSTPSPSRPTDRGS